MFCSCGVNLAGAVVLPWTVCPLIYPTALRIPLPWHPFYLLKKKEGLKCMIQKVQGSHKPGEFLLAPTPFPPPLPQGAQVLCHMPVWHHTADQAQKMQQNANNTPCFSLALCFLVEGYLFPAFLWHCCMSILESTGSCSPHGQHRPCKVELPPAENIWWRMESIVTGLFIFFPAWDFVVSAEKMGLGGNFGSSYALTISDVTQWFDPSMPVERWTQMSDLPVPAALCFLKSLSSQEQKSP